MKREINFRAWDSIDHMSNPFTLFDIQSKKIQFTSDVIIMQFTGLRNDINGKEPFEGDIVKYYLDSGIDGDDTQTEYIEIIEWECCGFELDGVPLTLLEDIPFEIIGNIHENSSLL